MKKLLVGAALMMAAAPAFAQVTPPPGVAQGTTPVPLPPGGPDAPHTRMMVMSDRTMTRAEVSDHVRKFFARLDANHDGFVTREEMDAMHQRMGMGGEMGKRFAAGGPRADRGATFDRLDTNHDGVISRQEYMAAQPRMREERVFVMRQSGAPGAPGQPDMRMHMHGSMGMGFGRHLFDMADANHDGRVSLQEAETAALAQFDRADLNHDSKLTPEERQQAHQLMRQHRPS
jgi:EF hand domain-containing protein